MDLVELSFVSVDWQAQKRHNLSILHGVGESSPVEKDEVPILFITFLFSLYF